MKSYRKIQIGIVGWAGREEYPIEPPRFRFATRAAAEAGYLLGQKGIVVFTGGKGGVMAQAARGVRRGKGMTIGVIRGENRRTSNRYIDIEIVTGTATGGSENILVTSIDGLLVFGGGAGTLQEIALAYRLGKPIVILAGCGGWGKKIYGNVLDERNSTRIFRAKTPKKAVETVLELVEAKWSR
ncbi:MAG: TIGR00725 family protein [Patescibacteria group bacterium]